MLAGSVLNCRMHSRFIVNNFLSKHQNIVYHLWACVYFIFCFLCALFFCSGIAVYSIIILLCFKNEGFDQICTYKSLPVSPDHNVGIINYYFISESFKFITCCVSFLHCVLNFGKQGDLKLIFGIYIPWPAG
jgi:hypothetical protein